MASIRDYVQDSPTPLLLYLASYLRPATAGWVMRHMLVLHSCTKEAESTASEAQTSGHRAPHLSPPPQKHVRPFPPPWRTSPLEVKISRQVRPCRRMLSRLFFAGFAPLWRQGRRPQWQSRARTAWTPPLPALTHATRATPPCCRPPTLQRHPVASAHAASDRWINSAGNAEQHSRLQSARSVQAAPRSLTLCQALQTLGCPRCAPCSSIYRAGSKAHRLWAVAGAGGGRAPWAGSAAPSSPSMTSTCGALGVPGCAAA